MAIFTPGPIVSDIRGSIGGTTFTIGTSGNIAKRRSGPRNSVKGLRSTAQNNLAGVAKAFTQLNSTQQASWRSFASANPVPKRLGGTQLLSASAMYMYLNGVLQAIRHPIQDSPPLSLFVDPITDFKIEAVSGPHGYIHVTGYGDGISDPELFQFWLTAPLGAGRTTPASGYWKVPIEWQASGESIDVTEAWVQRFGAIPLDSGQTILGAARIINKANGAHTPLLNASATFETITPPQFDPMIINSGKVGTASTSEFFKPAFGTNPATNSVSDASAQYNLLVTKQSNLRFLGVKADTPTFGGDLDIGVYVDGIGPVLTVTLPSGQTYAVNNIDVAIIPAGSMIQFSTIDPSSAGWANLNISAILTPT